MKRHTAGLAALRLSRCMRRLLLREQLLPLISGPLMCSFFSLPLYYLCLNRRSLWGVAQQLVERNLAHGRHRQRRRSVDSLRERIESVGVEARHVDALPH